MHAHTQLSKHSDLIISITCDFKSAKRRGNQRQPNGILTKYHLIHFYSYHLTLLSAAELDQQGYTTDRLPDLPLPRSARRQPTPQEAQDIKRLLRHMLAFEPAQRPSISAVVTAFENFACQFPMN